MGSGCFRSIIREVGLGVSHDPGHGGDDDDGRVLVVWCGLQEWKECDGAEEDGCDIGVIRLVPFVAVLGPEIGFHLRGIGSVGEAFGASDASGGDKERKVLLFAFDGFAKRFQIGFGGDVAGSNGDDLPIEIGVG